MKPFIPLFSLFLFTACAFGSLERLRLLDPEANNFSSALSAEYLAYANAEAEQGHSLTAEYFADKGFSAWQGKDVPPEPIERFLPKPAQARLESSREMLVALLTDDIKHVVPQQAARAQLLFDCWAKQEGQRNKDAPSCAEELPSALVELQTVATSFALGSETVHTALFPSGSARMGKTSAALVKEIAGHLRNTAAYVIELEGRADSDRAKRLLEARAAALRKAFAASGVPEDRIRIKDSGGSQAVYLSCDETVKDKNAVRITLRAFGSGGKPADNY